MTSRFHLSLATRDLEQQRAFYVDVLGCSLARIAAAFEDYDFFGHQLTFHRSEAALGLGYEHFHFGAIVGWSEFHVACARLQAAGARFLIEPVSQAVDTVDERRKLVVLDPTGYAVELKCYRDDSRALMHADAYPR
jgi:extradiol dioxygenase family protein